jgi:hypothetical protein
MGSLRLTTSGGMLGNHMTEHIIVPALGPRHANVVNHFVPSHSLAVQHFLQPDSRCLYW